MAERTYLELSEDQGVSHKFYEVVVDGASLTIRYGRIGTNGQSSTKDMGSPEKAAAEASKLVSGKRRKGYADAVQGQRQARSITRRAITSTASTAKRAPVLWKFGTGAATFGIHVDDQGCWVGNQAGRVFRLDHDGKQVGEYRLPEGVKCIVADGDWIYAGCDDGNVYDLTGKAPFVAYAIASDVNIYWLDIADGVLGVSDDKGNVHVFNHEDETQWSAKSGGTHGWMVRCDEIGVYHGHGAGVTMYDWEDGSTLWERPTNGAVMFGWQEESTVYAGTSGRKVHRFSKQGQPLGEYTCDAAVFSCAATEDGKYVFAGDNASSVYCFEESGKRLWKMDTRCGSAFSMQYHRGRLYLVTTTGELTCIDASEAAITAAESGVVPQMRDLKASTAPAANVAEAVTRAADLEATADAGSGVIVECTSEGGKVRVRVVSAGYDSSWNVQFPRNLREAGARYVCDEIRESGRGGFYRAYGNIRKLTS